MAYSTLANIRDEAGFTNNNNVLDAKITGYQSAATSHINGILGRVYALPLTSTPAIVELIERRLAAGYLLLDEYGEMAEGTDKDGNQKINWAEKMLQEIESGAITLYDATNTPLTGNTQVNMKGWPNNSTAGETEDNAGGDIQIRISHKF